MPSHINYKYSKINSANNNAEIEVIEHNGKKYGYIVLNYNFDLSSNSFNLYTTDNNGLNPVFVVVVFSSTVTTD